ncbi:hypothetical protein DEO72_LG2g2748 [Vigna unguiculata]|uniref:Uncharacterized protein n=1 Tax=Vigna unguiculata TaxID=3917 RepID=A0A4D6L1P7_VIGUN|nr:hypothetical protein DEO72_LG2g2748 [Vigna unguiculata]
MLMKFGKKKSKLVLNKIQQSSLSLPLTERSVRVLPKVPFELAQTSSYSASRDNSAIYRTARTFVNPSSKYGKLDPLRVVCCVLYRCEWWCEQWQTLIVSPRRARLAQAICAGARPGFPARVVAQATRPSLRRRRTRLSEIVSLEQDPSAWARVALQWSGRNPMAPVSGCPWWCPICITNSGMSSSGSSKGIHHKCKHPLNPTKLYVSG